jgi:hypothetical protein
VQQPSSVNSDRVEAELAVIEQEHLLQNLVTTGELTAKLSSNWRGCAPTS